MGVPHVFLYGLTAITLSEIYCLVVSGLLAYGAIDNPGLTDADAGAS